MKTIRERFAPPDAPLIALLAAGAAALVAREITEGRLLYGVALAALPALAWLTAKPAILIGALGATLPLVQNLVGASGGGYNVSSSDLLMVAIGGGILLERTAARPVPIRRALRPIAAPLIQYGTVMVLLFALHPLDVAHFAKTGQRFELFLLPLAIGAYAALRNLHLGLLKAYLIAATALAIAWPFDHGLGQKNPVGQFIANAILLFLALPALRRFLPCLLFLIPGLLLTQSRGAILATGVGAVVILAIRGFGLRFIVSRGVPFALAAAAAFLLLPGSYQSRVTTISPGQSTPAQYAIYIREQLTTDAKKIIRAHPLTGVGVGEYYAADSKITADPVLDPHEVLYLQAAEGGYGLAVSFVLLVVGLAFAVWRMKNVPVAAAAAGVLIATATHGLVDVFWVRGTPVLGFLLVGMACGSLLRERENIE
ncbi:MAG: O-antigen ligase family protein [Actinobacteria bacterium]|nr:O-antigen ligase family protein [Actinomycetota bacterium]